MKLILRDRSEKLVEEWHRHFRGLPDVEIGCGDIFDVAAQAIVSPANSRGFMNGGIDLVYSRRFGWQLQDRLREVLAANYHGELPVGDAVVVVIGIDSEPYEWLIAAPTMPVPMDIGGTINPYLAMRAVLRAAQTFKIRSVLCPGLGTNIGRIPEHVAAFQMREAYRVVVEDQRPTLDTISAAYCYHEALRRGLPYLPE